MLWAQGISIGGSLFMYRSGLRCATDAQINAYQNLSPTYNAAFGLQGAYTQTYWGVGLELMYGGQAQKYYGNGVTGKAYQAKAAYQYVGLGLFVEGRLPLEKMTFWLAVSGQVIFPVAAQELYQGDSVPRGNLYRAQLIQNTLGYLEASDDPEERQILSRAYRRALQQVGVRGGVELPLSEILSLRAGIFFSRSLHDIENKTLPLGKTPFYDSQRKPTYASQLGCVLGLWYRW
ncbi:MAG: hypothetical protein ACUVRD_08585 [Bacteroidia bacterium]